MEQVSLTGQVICAAIMAGVFYFAASLVMTMAVPITELSGAGASPIYQLVLIGFGALGALVGWKSAELILQSALYLWIVDIVTAAIFSVWN